MLAEIEQVLLHTDRASATWVLLPMTRSKLQANKMHKLHENQTRSSKYSGASMQVGQCQCQLASASTSTNDQAQATNTNKMHK